MYKQGKRIHTYTGKDIWNVIQDDIFIIGASYLVVIVYCVICSRFLTLSNASASETAGNSAAVIQLYVDSLVPTALTLVLTGLIRSKSRGRGKWCWKLLLLGLLLFAMITAGFHPINSVSGLIKVVTGSLVLTALSLGVAFDEKTVADTSLGISGKREG